jgi:hypothetical protein
MSAKRGGGAQQEERPQAREAVDVEVGEVLVAEQRWRERRHLDRRFGIEVVPVAVHPVPERAEREEREVHEQHHEVHEVPHPGEQHGAQRQQKKHAECERNEPHFHEVRRGDVAHSDVVVQDVDAFEIGAARSAHELVAVDREPESFRELVREHRDAPEGEQAGDEQQGSRPEHGEPCPGGENLIEPFRERHDHRPTGPAGVVVDAAAGAPRGFTSR